MPSKNKQKSKKSVRFSRLLLVLGIAFTIYGAYGFLQWWRTTHKSHSITNIATDLTTTLTNSTDNPDETKVDPTTYTVAADMPRRILISSILSDGFIQKVGVDQHSAIAVPSNVHYAGWYTNSVTPGQPGLSIIDGHVSGKYSEGVFKRLGNLKMSDEFEVEFGDLSKKKFEVVGVAIVDEADAAKELFSTDPAIKQQLKLITCGGKFDAKTQRFAKRIIVSAKLI